MNETLPSGYEIRESTEHKGVLHIYKSGKSCRMINGTPAHFTEQHRAIHYAEKHARMELGTKQQVPGWQF